MKKERVSYRYAVFQNLRYILKGAWKWQPSVLPFMVLQSVSEGISGFIWLYGARYLISCIEHPEQTKNGLGSLSVIVLDAGTVLCVLDHRLSAEAVYFIW